MSIDESVTVRRPEDIFRKYLLDVPLEIPLRRVSELEGRFEGELYVLDAQGRPSRRAVLLIERDGYADIEYEGLRLGTVNLDKDLLGLSKIFVEYVIPAAGGLHVRQVSSNSRIERPGLEEIVGEKIPSSPAAPGIEAPKPPVPVERTRRTRKKVPPDTDIEHIPELLRINPLEYLAGKLQERILQEGLYDPKTALVKLGEHTYSLDDRLSYNTVSSITGHSRAAVSQWGKINNPIIREVESARLLASEVFCVTLCDISIKKSYTAGEIAQFYGISEDDASYLLKIDFFKESKTHQATIVRRKFREVYDLALEKIRSNSNTSGEGGGQSAEVTTTRTTPPLIDVRYDYGLQIAGELSAEARENAVSQVKIAYQSEFNRRLLEKFIAEGKIQGNHLLFGPRDRLHRQEYQQKIDTKNLAEVLVVDRKFLNEHIRQFPPSLYREGRNGIYISPFVALVWQDHFSTAGASITSKPLRILMEKTLLNEVLDQQLLSYLTTAGFVRKIHETEVVPCDLASTFYRGLVSDWAVTMRTDATRESLMGEIGYATQNQMIEMLKKKFGIERAYQKTEPLRQHAVLGMIHLNYLHQQLAA